MDNLGYKRYNDLDEFIVDAAEYLKRIIPEAIERGDYANAMADFDKRKSVGRLIAEFETLTKCTTVNKDDSIVYIGAKLLSVDVKDWANTSMNETTPLQDLIIRAILDMYVLDTQAATLAVCYLYNNINVTEQFIDDIIYIHSGLFAFDEWDDKHVAAVTDCAALRKSPVSYKPLIKLYGKERLFDKFGGTKEANTYIKVSFPIAQCVAPLSKEFCIKYVNEFKDFRRALEIEATSNIDVDED